MRRHVVFLLASSLLAASASLLGQAPGRGLIQRQAPCQVQYARAVETIGLARWSAPEAERPSIERLLNAAAKAKELVDSSFLHWEAPLCSAETLGKLHASVQTIQANGWLPSNPEEERHAEAAAANAELLKAINAGVGVTHPVASSGTSDSAALPRALSEPAEGLAD